MALVEAGLLALALFGLIHLGSQPKSIPYIVEVNKLGEVAYAGRLEPAQADSNVVKASIATFISDLRLVTPDAGLQAEAVNRVYAYISRGDPALGQSQLVLRRDQRSQSLHPRPGRDCLGSD